MIYIFIFTSKIIENTLATLRIIVLSNHKKHLAALLNLIMSIAWLISTGLAVTNLKEDPFKIIVFALGCFVGSYLGTYFENKLAIGDNILFIISQENIIETLKNYDFNKLNNTTYLTLIKRSRRKEILRQLKRIDKDIIIYSHLAKKLDLTKVG